jgi:hypothetical protein
LWFEFGCGLNLGVAMKEEANASYTIRSHRVLHMHKEEFKYLLVDDLKTQSGSPPKHQNPLEVRRFNLLAL